MSPELNNPMNLGTIEVELEKARTAYRNWGRWGQDDVIGTLNFITPEKVAHATTLSKRGAIFSLSQPFSGDGPQSGWRGRVNPVHLMRDTGTDAAADTQGFPHGLGGADDSVFMPLQCSTQWDGLGHIFDNKKAWNGRDCTIVDGAGDHVTGIETAAEKFVSRGVLLDVGRAIGEIGELAIGHPITEADLEKTIELQGASSKIEPGDIVLVRTGQYGKVLRAGTWGDYAGGDAPGMSFSSLGWLHRNEIAALATDTWGVEVRPAEFTQPCFAPFHQIAIPNMGLFLGEMFNLEALAADCHQDKNYEFLFIAPAISFNGAVGAPVHPIAIK